MPHQCTTCGQTFPDGSKEMLSGCPGCGGNKFQYLPSDILEEQGETIGNTSGAEPIADTATDPPEDTDDGVAETVGRAATTVRDYVARRGSETDDTADPTSADPTPASDSTPSSDPTPSADPSPSSDPSSSSEPETATEPTERAGESTHSSGDDADDGMETDAETLPAEADEEDEAQKSARGEMVDRTSLPDDTVAAGTSPPSEGRVVKEPDDDGGVDRPDLEDLRAELNEQFESIRIVAPGQYELNLMELYDREEHIIALQEDGRYVIQVPESWREADDE